MLEDWMRQQEDRVIAHAKLCKALKRAGLEHYISIAELKTQ